MFKESYRESSKIESKLETALELERDGFNEAAMHLVTKLTRNNPSCIKCRDHMSRMYVNNEKFRDSQDAKDFLKKMK